jgi:hypothetical protein
MTKKEWTLLRSTLRRASVRWPTRYEALAKARRPYKGANQRQKWEYRCNKCKKWFMMKEVQVDHIKPCGPLTDPRHVKSFVLTLFCGIKNFQVLCKHCHKLKTNGE